MALSLFLMDLRSGVGRFRLHRLLAAKNGRDDLPDAPHGDAGDHGRTDHQAPAGAFGGRSGGEQEEVPSLVQSDPEREQLNELPELGPATLTPTNHDQGSEQRQAEPDVDVVEGPFDEPVLWIRRRSWIHRFASRDASAAPRIAPRIAPGGPPKAPPTTATSPAPTAVRCRRGSGSGRRTRGPRPQRPQRKPTTVGVPGSRFSAPQYVQRTMRSPRGHSSRETFSGHPGRGSRSPDFGSGSEARVYGDAVGGASNASARFSHQRSPAAAFSRQMSASRM